MEQYRNLLAEKIEHFIILFKIPTSTQGKKAQDHIQQVKKKTTQHNNRTDIKEINRIEMSSNFAVSHNKIRRDENENTQPKLSAPNCQVNKDTASVCQRSHSTPNTPKQKTWRVRMQRAHCKNSVLKLDLVQANQRILTT